MAERRRGWNGLLRATRPDPVQHDLASTQFVGEGVPESQHEHPVKGFRNAPISLSLGWKRMGRWSLEETNRQFQQAIAAVWTGCRKGDDQKPC